MGINDAMLMNFINQCLYEIFLSRFIHDPPLKHSRTAAAAVCEKYDEAEEERAVNNGKDAVRSAQIRPGHCCTFRAYHHLPDSSIDPT